jgi:hypothetical protein
MLRILRRIALWILLVLVLLFTGINAGLYFFGDEIAGLATAQVNRYLKTKVAVGKVDVVFWKSFPLVSLRLQKVRMDESDSLTGSPLLTCDELMVAFRPLDLLRGVYIIRGVEISQGHINMADKGNRRNYDVIRTDSSAVSEGSSTAVDLQKVLLVSVHYRYRELSDQTDIYLNLKTFSGNGAFMDADFEAGLEASGTCNSLRIAGDEYVNNKILSLSGRIVAVGGEQYTFRETRLGLGKAAFGINGSIGINKKATALDLKIVSEQTGVGELLSLLPAETARLVKDYRSEGQIAFTASIKGLAGGNYMPRIETRAEVRDASFFPPGQRDALHHISGTLALANREVERDIFDLDVSPFSMQVGKGKMEGSFRMLNLSDPQLSCKVQGALYADDIRRLAAQDKVTAAGSIDINLDLQGRLSDFGINPGLVQANGRVLFHDVAWQDKARSLDLQQTRGECQITPQDLTLQGFSSKVSGQALRFTGHIPGFWPWLGGDQPKLEVNGSLETDRLDLAPFFVSNETQESRNTGSNIFSDAIELDLSLKIGQLVYRRFDAREVNGTAAFRRGDLNVTGLAMRTMGGFVNLRGTFKQEKQGYICRGIYNGDNIRISDLFYAFEDFGQTDLTHKHLDGNAGFAGEFIAPFSRDLKLREKELYAFADLEIEGGVLRNYAPLQSLSGFVKMEELKEIRFNKLKNQIEISNASIKIPEMLISNSALNIQISGIHTFDNHMNYNFKIRVADLLAAKYGWRKNNADGRYEDNGRSGMSMYVRMEGFPDNLKITYDKQTVKEKISGGVKQEKSEFRQALREEFRKRDGEQAAARPGEKKPAKKPEKVDWDED